MARELGGPELYQALKESLGLPDWVRSFTIRADFDGPVMIETIHYASHEGFGPMWPLMQRWKLQEVDERAEFEKRVNDGVPTWEG